MTKNDLRKAMSVTNPVTLDSRFAGRKPVLVGFNVNLGANLPGVVVTLLVFSWVAASLGVLAGSLVNSHDRVTGICILAARFFRV